MGIFFVFLYFHGGTCFDSRAPLRYEAAKYEHTALGLTLLAGNYKNSLLSQNTRVASGCTFDESHGGNNFTEM